MEPEIKKQIIFVLEDDNELMTAALAPDSDLDDENKQMNRDLIKQHEMILSKIDRGELLSQEDFRLIRDANQIHLHDGNNLGEHHQEAVELNEWLDMMKEYAKDEAVKILEEYLEGDPDVPAKVYRALHTLWEEATPNGPATKTAFDNTGKCLKCGSKVSFADVTDTLVFVGDEITKRYDGDITNRNCIKCHYPEQYPEFEDYDKE